MEKQKITISDAFIWAGVILIITILGYLLLFSFNALSSLEQQSHEHQLELLEIEKEIALINNQNKTIINYECEYKLMNLTNYYINELYQLQIYYETTNK